MAAGLLGADPEVAGQVRQRVDRHPADGHVSTKSDQPEHRLDHTAIRVPTTEEYTGSVTSLVRFARVAQLVEQAPCKRQVVGSNPTSGSDSFPLLNGVGCRRSGGAVALGAGSGTPLARVQPSLESGNTFVLTEAKSPGGGWTTDWPRDVVVARSGLVEPSLPSAAAAA